MTRAETLLEYEATLAGSDGLEYGARACGRERDDGTWEAWIEFEAASGDPVWRTSRETTQPNRTDAVYWATGVTPVYLEGALTRAMDPPRAVTLVAPAPPAFDGPREPAAAVDVVEAGEPVLDPFSSYASKGEVMLRRQLDALAAWHLRTIARSFRILTAAKAETLQKAQLIQSIVDSARAASGEVDAVVSSR